MWPCPSYCIVAQEFQVTPLNGVAVPIFRLKISPLTVVELWNDEVIGKVLFKKLYKSIFICLTIQL